MPPDPSHNPPFRRASRKTTGDDEADSRRARGEISCAECRRLKLKCDKKLPCSSCVRRGCPSICPKGTLSTGQGTRFVLADTTQLHAKIAEMGHRIHQLEDALAILQSGVSAEVHPLLREELLSIKYGPEKGEAPGKENAVQNDLFDPPIEALGTMAIGDGGVSRYFGPSAGAETLFMAGAHLAQVNDLEACSTISPEIARLSKTFPFDSASTFEEQCDSIFECLPPETRAWSLCETYMEHASWAFRPVKRDELIEDILSPIYKAVKHRNAGAGPFECLNFSPHKLAVLFIVFALGALMDLTMEPYSEEAELYCHLSRSCLSLRSIFESPEIATVQALLLIANYYGHAGRRYTMDSSWTMIAFGTKVAQTLGLHRDSSRWKMDPKTVQRRRTLFWEIYSTDLYYSLALGRPPSISKPYIDCEFPEDDEATVDDKGNTLIGYYRWKYEFTRDIFSEVIAQTLTAKAPSYQTILELDRKLREKALPPHLSVFIAADDEECTPALYMKRCLLSQYRAVTSLYIHRSFFAQAMLDHPENPLKSPYAPSFLAAYRCSSGVIKKCLNHYDRFPVLCGRWWSVWTHLFSAAIIVGSIVTRSPSSSMASSAFMELGLACDLFEKGAAKSRRSLSAQAILLKMREKAFRVSSQIQTGQPTTNGALSLGKPDYEEDELALFGGQTKVLVTKLLDKSHGRKKERQRSQPSSLTTPAADSPSSSSEGDPKTPSDSQDVHPSLIEYLSLFPPQNMDAPSASPAEPQGFNHPTASQLPEHHMPLHDGWSNWPPSAEFTSSAAETFDILPPQDQLNVFGNMPYPPGRDFLTSPSTGTATEGHFVPVTEFGMIMTGDSGMDEQWISFIKDSGLGLFPNNGNASGNSGMYVPSPMDTAEGSSSFNP